MLELKDRLDLAIKFLFLLVFTYGVISLTTCMSNCKTQCSSASTTQCCKANVPIAKQCGVNCSKPCCSK